MFSNEKWFGASADFYPETIGQSLRFEDGDSPRLSKTFRSGGNRKTWTWSAWVKRANLSSTQYLFHTFAQGGFGIEGLIAFLSDNTLRYQFDYNGGSRLWLNTNRVFRDTTNFFHLCCVADTSNSTQGDRLRMYINGVRETSFSTANYPTNTTTDGSLNSAYNHYISGQTNNTGFFDGYLAEVNFLDGVGVTDTSGVLDELIEIKNGVCIPKDYSGSYGTTGFRFTFADSSSLGDDTSGLSTPNDFATGGTLASTDVVLDSPTNNFCTLNSINNQTSASLLEGNLHVGGTGNNWDNIGSTFGVSSGKWYWEVRCDSISETEAWSAGIRQTGFPEKSQGVYVSGGEASSIGAVFNVLDNNKKITNYSGGSGSSSFTSDIASGDIVQFRLNLDDNELSVSVDGSDKGKLFDITANLEYTPFLSIYGGSEATMNFGQDSSFAGQETATSNSDANGNGTFHSAVPSGYLALCSANLPDSTISPSQETQSNDHMDIFLYTGDYSTNRDIALCNFTPDFSWNKGRSLATNHVLINTSVRNGSNYPNMHSNTHDKEANEAHPAIITNGIQVSQGSDNNNNETFVNWAWKCGGSTPTKTYKVLVVADSTDYGHGIGANKYRFYKSDNSTPFPQSAVDLDLQEGGTYTFDWSSATSHPIRFSLTNDGTHSSGTSAGSEYTTGVVKDDSAYKTTITVASGVASLYYYCQNHSGMGAEVRTNVEFGQTNFDGNLLSVSQTNVTAGFSIVKYTGNGDNPNADGTSVGHGLSAIPEMIIHKNRDSTIAGNNYWTVWTPFHSANNMSFLSFTSNNTGGWAGYNTIGNTTFSPPDSNYGNVSGEDYIVYLWHSVAGYSKIGQYEMNFNSDGTYVHCGFRPKFLVTKPIDQAGSWSVYDSARDPVNDGDANMSQWDNTTTESGFANSAVDFLSNGFKLRQSSDGYSNIATNTAIFMAFGNDFKFSNAK